MLSDHRRRLSIHSTIWCSIYCLLVIFPTKSSSRCLENSQIIECQNSTSTTNLTDAVQQTLLPITKKFKLSPLSDWPSGEGFASGTIDLGGLQVFEISTFTQIWATHIGGPENLGATFYEPTSIPEGFYMLGSYSQPNNKPLFGWVLVGKDTTNDPTNGSLTIPLDYTLIWTSESSNISQDGIGYIWLPVPPPGYKSVGHIITNSPVKPLVEKTRCVRSDFTDIIETDSWIWGLGQGVNQTEVNIYSSIPQVRGSKELGLPIGAFIVQTGGTLNFSLACLKNVNKNISGMPNRQQIDALLQAYSPTIYFHPDEQYLPSSVDWFFENGALLYQKGQESNPVNINPDGSNLPQGGSNDNEFWLDLPVDGNAKAMVKKGNLENATVYIHVKPVFGATFSDLVIWVFYPFNGPSRAKVEFITIKLGKIGEHVGDWEHLTLRVSNFNGELKKVFFSEHSGGTWVDTSLLEFGNNKKPVTYASLNAHAFYPNPGLVLLGGGDEVGIRDDSAKSHNVMDTGSCFLVMAAEYLPPTEVVEPPWLNYSRKWGPKISYDIDEELKKIEKVLLGKLKSIFKKFINSIPAAVLGEEGPVGPKMKNNWSGDEY